MKTRTLAPGAYLARSGQGISLYDTDSKVAAMNKMGGSILALALTGLSAEVLPTRCAKYFSRTPTQSRDEVWLDEMGLKRFPEFLAVVLTLRASCRMAQSMQDFAIRRVMHVLSVAGTLSITKSCTKGGSACEICSSG